MKMSEPPICPKCVLPMNAAVMEAVHAPPAPVLYLTVWSCDRHQDQKKSDSAAK